MGVSAGTLARDGGREMGGVRFEKWDLDQIAWTQLRDYEGHRLLRRIPARQGRSGRGWEVEEPSKRHF